MSSEGNAQLHRVVYLINWMQGISIHLPKPFSFLHFALEHEYMLKWQIRGSDGFLVWSGLI